MAFSGEIIEKARHLRAQGKTQHEIANELQVSERSVQRWLTSKAGPESPQPHPSGATPAWPEERRWPGWTAQRLQEMAGWTARQAEENLTLIAQAERLGQPHLVWFFKRMAETANEYRARGPDVPRRTSEWLIALAGLPVLADWMQSPECDALALAIADSRPWESREGLKRYQGKARGLVGPIRQALHIASGLRMMEEAAHGGRQGPILLLGALSERLPRLDSAPRFSLYGRLTMGHILLGIFLFPKGRAL